MVGLKLVVGVDFEGVYLQAVRAQSNEVKLAKLTFSFWALGSTKIA
jgi:hypothetical protein